ncbi:hypothetical protein BYT27DRAFT_6429778 [Phlegmacium glaucopus]|nr:hypothetical protein BYT27DRAFT_6429778 [Phlegmacium glaucopus]
MTTFFCTQRKPTDNLDQWRFRLRLQLTVKSTILPKVTIIYQPHQIMMALAAPCEGLQRLRPIPISPFPHACRFPSQPPPLHHHHHQVQNHRIISKYQRVSLVAIPINSIDLPAWMEWTQWSQSA